MTTISLIRIASAIVCIGVLAVMVGGSGADAGSFVVAGIGGAAALVALSVAYVCLEARET